MYEVKVNKPSSSSAVVSCSPCPGTPQMPRLHERE